MSLESVKKYLANYGLDGRVLEFRTSSATVEEAAAAAGVEPARIAKTLSFLADGQPLLICLAGDCRVDNAKYRKTFGVKARMIPGDDVARFTGHAPGGVCPFALPAGVKVYLDVSLRRFKSVFPACGSSSSAIELSPGELMEVLPDAAWVDVGKSTLPAGKDLP